MRILLTFTFVGSIRGDFWLQILHTNDLHARFDETNVYGKFCSRDVSTRDECFGGFARLKRAIDIAIEEAKRQDIPSINLNAGDTFDATLNRTAAQWRIVSEFVDKLNFDTVALGNHEFMDGLDDLASFLDNIKTPVVCCNLNSTSNPRLDLPSLRPSRIITVRDKKIGIVGYLNPNTVNLGHKKTLLLPEIPHIRAEARRLKSNGVDIIIALGHSGFNIDRQIAASIEEVSLVVGGHSHILFYNPPHDPPSVEIPMCAYPAVVTRRSGRIVPVVQAYAYTKYLGKLFVRFDDNGEVVTASGNSQLLDGSIEKDPQIEMDLSEWSDTIDQLYGTVRPLLRVSLLTKYFRHEKAAIVAEMYVNLFGKLSWYDHTLYEALLKSQTIEGFLGLIQSIPVVLSTEEKEKLETLVGVYLKYNEDYKKYDYKM